MIQNVDANLKQKRDMNLPRCPAFVSNLWDSYAIIYGDVKHFDSLVEPQIDHESDWFTMDICDFRVL